MAQFDINSIGQLLSGSGLSAISKRTKIKQGDVAKVLSAGIPALLSGMHDNSGSREGAESLSRALQDHQKVTSANVGAFLKEADLKDGKKILGHVLGSNQDALVSKIAGDTGVTKAKTTTILALVAPLLLSLLGNQNSGSGNILGLLGGLLGLSSSQQQQNNGLLGGGSLLGSLLGGGNTTQTSLGTSLLGSLLGGGQSAQPAQQQSSNSLFGSLLNLLH